MDSIFQSPWILIVTSAVVWLIAGIIRVSFPEKKRWWHMLVPVVIFAAAFGMDHFVKTDLEKVNALIDRGIEAAVAADISGIDSIIAENYSDRAHNSKADFMSVCRKYFRKPMLESIRRSYYKVAINGASAVIDMNAVVHLLAQNSHAAGIQMVAVKLKIECIRNSEKKWSISSVDLVELNNNPVNWNHI